MGTWIGDFNIIDAGSLELLAGFTSVIGDVWIENTPLSSLAGLECLQSIQGGLGIIQNVALATLSGLRGLSFIGGRLRIGDWSCYDPCIPELTSLDGLDNLIEIGGVLEIGFYDFESVASNEALTNIDGLSGLESIGGSMRILGNPVLTRLAGLRGITSIEGSLEINGNSALTSVEGLNNIESIAGRLGIGCAFSNCGGGNGLTTLDGLRGLTSVGEDLSITYNADLPNCEATGVLDRLVAFEGEASIYCNLSDTCPGIPTDPGCCGCL
jgi:hypothetical protein